MSDALSLPTAPRFGEVATAMVTPFDLEGNLNCDRAQDLARWLVANGSDSLVLVGTTGESPVLDTTEEVELVKAVTEVVDVPILVGTGSNNTREAVATTERMSDIDGVSGLLVVGPYYNKPSQRGIANHFQTIGESTDKPIVIYDIPGRTGSKIATSTIIDLVFSDPEKFVGLKDAAGNIAETGRLITEVAKFKPDFDVYSGNDDQTLPLLAVGAKGVISVASHWAGPETKAMIQAFNKGDHVLARAINSILGPSFAIESTEEDPNPVAVKYILNRLGLHVGMCREPNFPPSPSLIETAPEVVRMLRADYGDLITKAGVSGRRS